MPVDTKERENSFWLVPFVVDTSKLKCTMKEFIAAVQAEGACAYSVLWPEMYKEEAFAKRKGFGKNNYPFGDPAHRKIDYTKFNCTVAQSLADTTISFWTHPTYTLKHIEADIKAFKKVADAMMK
jgi:dTDP-4-amino-4,6-dideoxygalactose transaminase